MKRRLFVFAELVGALSTLLPQAVLAQVYPNRALKMLVPFTAGGSSDMVRAPLR